MKKSRVLSIFLCIALVIGLITPVQQAQAKDNVVHYEATQTLSPWGSWFSFDVRVNVTVNRSKKKADITFSRNNFVADWDYLRENETKAYKSYKNFIKSNTHYGHCTADVVEDNYDKGSKIAFKLKNFVWDTAKFNVDGSAGNEKYAGYVININGWKQVFTGGLGSGYVGCEKEEKYDWIDGWSFAFKLLDKPGEPLPQPKEYMIGHDNFSFSNSTGSFFKSKSKTITPKIFRGKSFANGTYGYLLDDKDYESLMKGRDNNQIAAINMMLSRKWGGNCRGMSIMSGVLFENKISLKDVGKAKEVYGLKKPSSGNSVLSSAITYYQIAGNFERLRYLYLNYDNYPGSRTCAKALVKALQDDPDSPVVVGFGFSEVKNGKKVYYGHAVLAFKVEDTGSDHKVTVYDPNEPKKERYIYITDKGDASFAQYGTDIFIKPIEKAKDAYDAKLVFPEVPDSYVVVKVNGNVEITVGDKKAVIKGDTVTGDLEVSVEKEYGSDLLTILVPVEDGQSVHVRMLGGTDASVETNDTTALITGGNTEMTVEADGSVSARSNGSKGSLAVVSNKTKGDLFGTTVTTDSGETTITPTSDGAKIKTDDKKADITVSGKTKNVTFENIDASNGADIKTNGNKATLSSDGKKTATGTADDNGGSVKYTNDSDKNDDNTDNGTKTDDTEKKDTGSDNKNDQKTPANPDLKIKKDNDVTGFTPADWTPVNVYKTTKKYFIPGKYVRKDGKAVLYIKSSKSKSFYYVLYQTASDSGKKAYYPVDKSDLYNLSFGPAFLKASIKSKTKATDDSNALTFKANKNGSIKITSDWSLLAYTTYDAPDGIYYLVEE